MYIMLFFQISHSIAEMYLMRPDVHQYFLCQQNTAASKLLPSLMAIKTGN